MIPGHSVWGFFVVGGTGLAHGPACRSGRRASQFSRKKSNKKSSSAEAELPGLRYGVNQRLLNWGARRAAFRPYFTKPKLDFA